MADPVAFEFETAKQLMRLLKKSKDGVFNSEVDDSIPLDHAPAFIWAYVPATVTCTYDSTVKAWIIGGATTCYPINSGVDADGLMQWGKNNANGIVTGGITCTTFTPKLTSDQAAPSIGKGFYLGTIFGYNGSEQPRVLIGLPPVSSSGSSGGSATIDVVTDVQCGPEGLTLSTITFSGADYDNAVIRQFLALSDVTQKSYVANQGRCVVVNAEQTGLEFGPVVGDAADTFIGLSDTPQSYGSNAYNVLIVSSTNAGVSFSDNNITTKYSIKGGGNPNNPNTYEDLQLVNDKASPSPFSFYGTDSDSTRGFYTISFKHLNDTSDSYTGSSGKYLKVNSGGTGIDFAAIDLDTLQTDLATAQGDITTLQTDLSSLALRVTALEGA